MTGSESKFDDLVLAKNYKGAMLEMNKLWLDTMVHLTKLDSPELKELNYINVQVDTGDGEYMLAFMHVGGKKIQLQEEK